ncbi:VOC family protein [Methylacidiphilum caldifontis]|uniref:Lactoylglutathione lyase n=1 Tax=Methylacidiphilum caldifontis TaxID=2795386 RepID=A0A4Y8PH43_9BACT|nr:VOC family protein [Methylacidiphilum caldifontis]QSR88787.1 VOC family protein [Methylacidiphilum caldifontis]TFE71554.1 lactoylglutathione lyase [Methylacidiphilum caldifontis]
MLIVESIHHVTLPVKDLNQSVGFYSKLLGLKQIERPPFPFSGAWFQVGTQQLHLTEWTDEKKSPDFSMNTRDHHVAFRVKSINEALEWLRKQGYREDHANPSLRLWVKLDSVAGFPQIFLFDPDGHLIEINAQRKED